MVKVAEGCGGGGECWGREGRGRVRGVGVEVVL